MHVHILHALFVEEGQSLVQTVRIAGREAAAMGSSALMVTSVKEVLAKGIADLPCPHKRNQAVGTSLW